MTWLANVYQTSSGRQYSDAERSIYHSARWLADRYDDSGVRDVRRVGVLRIRPKASA